MATPALRVNGVNFPDGTSLGLSAAGQAVLRYNNTSHALEVSANGGAYGSIGGGGSLQADYTAGGAGGGAITLTSTGGGIQIKDNATPISGNLFSVTDSGGTNVFFSVSASSAGSSVLTLGDGASAAVGAAGTGEIRYNNTSHVFEQSLNGGAWSTLGGGSTGNWTFSGNVADLSAAGAMQLGSANATSVKFIPSTFNFPSAMAMAATTAGATNTTGLTIAPNVADGASSIGLVINSGTSLSTGSLVAFENAGVTKLKIAADGSLVTPTALATLKQTGGTFGETGLLIQNEAGSNGPQFYNNGVALLDFQFNAMSTIRTMRLEGRVGNCVSGQVGEFQIGIAGNSTLCISDNDVIPFKAAIVLGTPAHPWASTASQAYFTNPQANTVGATFTIDPTLGSFVKQTLTSATNVTAVTISAGTDGQELEVHIIQPAAGTAATMVTTWTNVSFAGTAAFTATLGKRDIYTFRYSGTTSKWYETRRSLNVTN